jgi:hypothetical protein
MSDPLPVSIKNVASILPYFRIETVAQLSARTMRSSSDCICGSRGARLDLVESQRFPSQELPRVQVWLCCLRHSLGQINFDLTNYETNQRRSSPILPLPPSTNEAESLELWVIFLDVPISADNGFRASLLPNSD